MTRAPAARNLDLAGVVVLSALLPLAVFLLPSWASPLRVFIGFLFTLVVPGFAVAAALFPAHGDLDDPERLALSLGLSIAVIPLLGLGVHYSPWRIDATTMTVGIMAVSLSACSVALLRRSRSRTRRGERPSSDAGAPRRRPFMAGLGLLMVVGAAWSVVVVTTDALRPSQQATEFYVLGQRGTLEAYPQQLAARAASELTVGITNHEGRQETYEVRASWLGGDAAVPVPPLEDGASWRATIPFTAPSTEGTHLLTLELFRADQATAHRSLHLWLDVGAAPADRVGQRQASNAPESDF